MRALFPPFEFDPDEGVLYRDGEEIPLPRRASDLLGVLLERGESLVSKDELLQAAWPGVVVTEDSLFEAVAVIRRALGDDAQSAAWIRTVPGRGYRFLRSVEWTEAPRAGGRSYSAAESSSSDAAPWRTWWPFLGALGIVTVVVLGIRWSAGTDAPVPAVARPTLQLAWDASLEGLSWSPDGERIAFSSDADGSYDVWTCSASGRPCSNLTRALGGDERYPSWSPDGTRIAFIGGPGDGDLFTVDAMGADLERVSSFTEVRDLAWTAQLGLVFRLRHPELGWQVYRIVDPPEKEASKGRARAEHRAGAESGLVCLTCALGGTWSNPRISPDGRYLAAKSPAVRGPSADLVVVGLEDGTRRVVARRVDALGWAGSSEALLYTAYTDGFLDLWRGRVSSQRSERLTAGLKLSGFRVSHDGTVVLATSPAHVSAHWMVPLTDAPASLERGRRLFTDQGSDWEPRVTAEQDAVIFDSDRGGLRTLWRMDLDRLRADPVPVSDKGGVRLRGRPSPDGRWLLSEAWAGPTSRLYLMPSDGGDEHVLPSSWDLMAFSDWSDDSGRVAFLGGDDAIVVATVGRGGTFSETREVVTLSSPGAADVTWTPDQRHLAFTQPGREAQIWRVRVDGGPVEPLVHLPGRTRRLRFSADGSVLYFRNEPPGQRRQVWRVDVRPDGTPTNRPREWLSVGPGELIQEFDIVEDRMYVIVETLRDQVLRLELSPPEEAGR